MKNDTEMLDWLDKQEGIYLTQDEDSYWYIRKPDQLVAVGYPFIREAIYRAMQDETNSTLR